MCWPGSYADQSVCCNVVFNGFCFLLVGKVRICLLSRVAEDRMLTNKCVVTSSFTGFACCVLARSYADHSVCCNVVFNGFCLLCVGQDRTLTNQCVVTLSSTGFACCVLARPYADQSVCCNVVFNGFCLLRVSQDRTLTDQCVVTLSSTGFACCVLARSYADQ